jgi:rhodanese-related sulfurtransferase
MHNMPIRDIVKECLLILAVALVAAFSVNALSPRGIALVGEWDTAAGAVTAWARDGVVERDRELADLAQVRRIHADKTAVFIDARSPGDFADGHVPDAVSFPVNEFDERIGDFWEAVPLEAELIVYCSGRECEDSHRLAGLLQEAGYLNVRVFIDGFSGWADAGYPISQQGAGNRTGSR